MSTNNIRDIIDRLTNEMIIPTYTFPSENINTPINNISGSNMNYNQNAEQSNTIPNTNSETVINNDYIVSPPLPPRNIPLPQPLPPPYPPPSQINNLSNMPSHIIDVSNTQNNQNIRHSDNDSDRDIDRDSDRDSDTEFIFNDLDDLDHIEDIDEINKERTNHLYDCDDTIYELNNYKSNNHTHFLHTIHDLNKELHNLYKKNLKLNNDNYYIHNKNHMYKNTIKNYKDIIISHKKYIKDLYKTKQNLMEIYNNNTHNLKNIITSQNTIINKFKDSLKCSICYSENINTILSPCNHCVMCDKCYNSYIQYDDTCPLCKTYIENYIKIYLPNLN